MPNTGPVSVSRILQYPFIAGLVSRLASAAPVMSRTYNVNLSVSGSGTSATVNTGATQRSAKRDIVYDVYDGTRLATTLRAPGTGPSRRKKKPIGTGSVRGVRVYDALDFTYEELRDYRPMGGSNPSQIDRAGATYVANQASTLIQRSMNMRELFFSRMLKGNIGVKQVGDDWWPVIPNAGGTNYSYLIDYKLPASHKDQLAVGGTNGTTDVIGASWANPATDVLAQLHELRSVSMRRSGLELTDIWINSLLFSKLQNNTKLQAIGGSAFRVFDRYSRSEVAASEVGGALKAPMPYYYYQFRGLPQMNVHVYDGGLTMGAGVEDDSTDADNWYKFLEDDEAIITPSPSSPINWFESYDIAEWVQEQYASQAREVYGFHSWVFNEPKEIPSIEFRVMDNFAFALTIPNAVYNPTVVF
jgi:hypothetical protein